MIEETTRQQVDSVFNHRRLCIVTVFAGMIAAGGIASRIMIARNLDAERDRDSARVMASVSSVPEPAQERFGTLSPYHVESEYDVRVSALSLQDTRVTFLDDELGLEVDIAIHRCRPRTTDRLLNLVNGACEDHCTSGGVLTILDVQRGEKFEVYFKLMGAPNGIMGWDARQLVNLRDTSGTWLESLDRLRQGLPRYELAELPPSVSRTEGRLESRAAGSPHSLLLSGDEEEMLKMLAFRAAFREFYDNPNSLQAKYVARMLIETLLDSPEQREVSERLLWDLRGEF